MPNTFNTTGFGMTSRSHHVTFAIGCTIVVVVTLLILLQKTHTQLQDAQLRLLQTDSKYTGLSRQFDSLYEYKTRLEKSFINLKNERASILELDDGAKDDMSLIKSNCEKQVRNLEEELNSCKNREIIASLREGGTSADTKTKTSLPLLAPLSVARENLVPSPTNVRMLKLISPSAGLQTLHKLSMGDLKEPKENEAIQSPIGHVSAHPGQPSGDPNDDTAGNVLI